MPVQKAGRMLCGRDDRLRRAKNGKGRAKSDQVRSEALTFFNAILLRIMTTAPTRAEPSAYQNHMGQLSVFNDQLSRLPDSFRIRRDPRYAVIQEAGFARPKKGELKWVQNFLLQPRPKEKPTSHVIALILRHTPHYDDSNHYSDCLSPSNQKGYR